MSIFKKNCDEILQWLAGWRARSKNAIIRPIKFEDSRNWQFDESRSVIRRDNRKFFTVRGVKVPDQCVSPSQPRFQPIIDQAEKGILGLLAQVRNHELHFLFQAKPEPGNIGLYQLAPTVQATESNFRRAHGGRETRFLEYFTHPDPAQVLLHQLQSEQGTRFLKKRNRNMVVLLAPENPLEIDDRFVWISLSQVSNLLPQSNTFNTDSRSVLACLPLGSHHASESTHDPLRLELRKSLSAAEQDSQCTFAQLMHWFTQAKLKMSAGFELVPLCKMDGWRMEDDQIRPEEDRFFSLMQIEVQLENREVSHWDQPIVSSYHDGLVGLICQRRGGVLHFLVQAKREPCHFDSVEMTATVDCFPGDQSVSELRIDQPFFDLLHEAPEIHFDFEQSDEGSRFYLDNSRYMLVELSEETTVANHPDYCWMTLAQVFDLVRFGNHFSNQMRSLIALLRLRACC